MTNQLRKWHLFKIGNVYIFNIYYILWIWVKAEINNNVIDPQIKLISNKEIFSDIEPAGT